MGRALRSSKSRYWGTPCSPRSAKPPRWVPVAVAGGCSVQGPLSTCVPAGTEHTCAQGVPGGEHIPADTACAPAGPCVRRAPRAQLCPSANSDADARPCSCTCALRWHSPACLGMCSRPQPSPAVLACWVWSPREPLCPGPFAALACLSWRPASMCVFCTCQSRGGHWEPACSLYK